MHHAGAGRLAAGLLEDLYRSDSSNLEYAYRYADALVRAGRNAEAVAIVEDLVRKRPRYVNALTAAVRICLRAGEATKALAFADDAVNMSPSNAEALVAKALVCLDLRHFQEMEQLWAKVPRNYSTYEAELIRLNVLRRHEGKDAVAKRVRELEPLLLKSETGRHYLPHFFAIADETPSIETKQASRDAAEDAIILLKAHKAAEALELLQTRPEESSFRYWGALCMAAFILKDYKQSFESGRKSIALGSTDPVSQYYAAMAALICRQYKLGRKWAIEAAFRAPALDGVFALGFRVALLSGRWLTAWRLRKLRNQEIRKMRSC
jgi:tetratricopeptide (TPR) repeat protein